MFIKLTFSNDRMIRINVNHITDYVSHPTKTGSYVGLSNHTGEGFLTVTETPEQIDALIKASPNHPEVLSLEDINDGN